MKRNHTSGRRVGRGVTALLVAGAVIALGMPGAVASWHIHNDADVTQITPPPGTNDESLTCANVLRGQTAWSTFVPDNDGPLDRPALAAPPVA